MKTYLGLSLNEAKQYKNKVINDYTSNGFRKVSDASNMVTLKKGGTKLLIGYSDSPYRRSYVLVVGGG